MMNYVVIIPARAGSKTIKNKNMMEFNNKPLLDWTIDAIKPFGIPTYLLTDSDEYISHAVKKGIEYIKQDKIGSSTKMDENLLPYIYPRFKDYHIILLQPTSPLRLFNIIQKCLEKYDGHSLLTVEGVGNWLYRNNITPLFDRFNRPLKQDSDFNSYQFYDGNILIRNINEWYSEKCIVGEFPVLVKNSKINSLQIDTLEDIDEFYDYINWGKV